MTIVVIPDSPAAVLRILHLILLALGVALLAPIADADAQDVGFDSVELVGIDGEPFDPARLTGKVVLVVNVASFCSYTVQYADLQHLYDTYGARGLVVLGVPSNQFGGQEPGSDAEIRNFCKSQYGVTFPLLTKQPVNGPDRSPLYRWLVDSPAGKGRDVGWNFEKFLVGRDGTVIGRFGSAVHPRDPSLIAAIEMSLAQER